MQALQAKKGLTEALARKQLSRHTAAGDKNPRERAIRGPLKEGGG